jgi:hypothetical protein
VLPLPWLYVRRHLAKVWGIPPWVVDEVPFQEVDLELHISDLEAQHLK